MQVRSDWQTLREVLQLLWTVADAYAKRRLLLALGLVASGALLSALTPLALKLAVDALTQGSAGPALLTPLMFVILYVLGQYFVRFLTEIRTLVYGQADQRVRRHLGRQLFDHLVRLPLRFHLERKTGAMGETAQQGIQGYQLLLNHMIYTILPVAVEFVAVAIVLVNLGHAAYLVILALSSIAYVAVFQRGAASVQEPARSISAAHIEAHAVMTDSLINFETVKYFDAEPVVSGRYDMALGRTESAWRHFFRRRAVNGVLVASIFALSLGAALIYAANDVVRGTMTVGGFVLINAYIARLVQPLEMLGFAVRDIAQALAFLEKMLDLFREPPEGGLRHGGPYEMEPLGALIFHNVSFSYRHDQSVLKGVSFCVPAGRTVAVVGVSGSGKSSLIRLLFRLYEPDCGRIVLDGLPIAELPLSTVRQAIAVVPQDTVLFHDTIANNIGFGRRGSSMDDIKEAARIANLHDFIMSMPDAYETVVGERGLRLSGGERQRVAIARAALKRPRIFVFDEATSSLDSKTEREILRNLLDVSRKCTTLVIAHRLSTVVHADEILVLDRGVIVERGTHAELQRQDGHYAALWEAQHGDVSSLEASVAECGTRR
ncbi:MAG TPA: ATP-binding cassette domain-containing protein [Steroidobacteraceae bacterium]|jgi:ATP-binding cassette subfamily B protein